MLFVASFRRIKWNALKRSLTPSFCLFRRSELLLLMVARDMEAGRFGGVDKKTASTSSWLGAAAMRSRRTSTLAWRRGQRQASFFIFLLHGAF